MKCIVSWINKLCLLFQQSEFIDPTNYFFRVFQLNGIEILYFFISLGVTYPGIDYLRQAMNKIGIQNKEIQVAVLDCSHISSLDYTAMKGLESITADYATRGQAVAFLHMPRSAQPLLKTAKNVRVIEVLKEIINFLPKRDSLVAVETKI